MGFRGSFQGSITSCTRSTGVFLVGFRSSRVSGVRVGVKLALTNKSWGLGVLGSGVGRFRSIGHEGILVFCTRFEDV